MIFYDDQHETSYNDICSSNGKMYKLIGDDGMGGLTFHVPKSLLSINFRDPLTEKQREALLQRASAANVRRGNRRQAECIK